MKPIVDQKDPLFGMKLTPVGYNPFEEEDKQDPLSGFKLTPVGYNPFEEEDKASAPVQAAPAVPPVQPVSGKAERAALVRPVGIEARLDQAQRQAQADKDPVLAPEEDPSLWENFKTGLREVGSDARDMLGYAPEQALAISTQAIDFLPAMVRGVRETNRQVWGAILGEDKVQQLEEMQKKVPILGTMLQAGENLLDASGNLRRDAQELLIQKAMDEGGVSGVVAASLVDTVMQTLMQLKTFKALRIQYGKQPDIKSTLMGAGMRAALSAISHEGLSPKERIGAFALSMAYQSTPALSGTIGKWTKSDWVAKGVDIAANAGITTTQWAQMVEDSHAEAEARGMPESSGIFLIMNLVKSYGSDVVFGAMTDAFKQRGNPEAARVLEKAAQDAGIPVKRKPVLAKPPVAEEPAREAEQPAPVETPVKTPVEAAKPPAIEPEPILPPSTPPVEMPKGDRLRPTGEAADRTEALVSEKPAEQARPPAAVPAKPPELMTPEEYINRELKRNQIDESETSRLAEQDRAIVTGNAEEAHANLLAEMADQHKPLNADAVEAYYPKLDANGEYKDRKGNLWQWTGYKLPSGYVREGDRYVFKGEAAPKPVDALKAKMAKGKKEAVKTTAIDALKAKMADKIQTQQTDKGDVRVSVPEKDTPKITPKEQKKYIIEELDVAIKDAPMALESMPPKGKNDSDWSVKQNKAIEKAAKAENITPEQWIANNHRASEGDPDKVIIEVPGDGVFTVKNDKSVLMAFREQVGSKLPTETKEKRTERLKAFETDAEREGWGKQVSQFEERRAESMRKVKRKVKKKDIIPARYIDPYGIPIPKGYIKLRPYSAFYEYNPASINPKPAPIPGMKAAAAEKAVPEKIEETSQSGFAFVPAGMPGVRDALNWTFRQHGGVDERIVPKIEKWQRQRNMIDLSAKMMSDNVRMVKDELNALGLKDDVKQSYSSDMTKVMEGVMRLDEFKKKHGYIFGSTNPKLRAAAEKTVGFLDKIRDYREKFVSDIVPTMKRIGLSDEAATIEANKMMYVPYEYMKWIDPFFKPKAADKERAVDTIKSEYVNDIIKLRGNVNAFGEYDKILSFLKTGDMTGLKPKDAQQEVALNTLRQDFLSMTPFIKDIQLQKETGQIDFDMRLGNIQSSAREYVDSLLTGRKSGGTGNPFDVSHLMKRKLPEVFQQLYGRIEDPERVVNSMVKIQQNLLNTTRFLDQILSMNSDDSGRPIYSAKPSPENGLTVKLTGKQYAALDGMYVSKELARVLRDDIIRFKQAPTTIPDKVADAVKDFYRLSVKTGRTAAIFTSRLVQRNIQTNLTYPMMSGDWLRKGHVKHEADGWKLVADVYQYMAGRVPADSERYKRVTKMLQELGDNGVYYIKQSGIGADLDAFADNHGFMTPSKAPAVIKQWYESKLDEARSYYSLADLPYKYAMWKTALERFKGDKEKAREHVQRYGQYPEKLGRGLKSWSKLPLADFPTFMFDAVRIHANATVDFAKNVANLGRGGDWQQVIGYLIGTATSAAVMTPSAKAIKLGFKKGMDAIRNVVQGEDQDTEFQELEPEQEGALYDLVPRYDQNNPSYIWKEVRKDGQVTIRRIPTRGFTTPLPLMEMSSGVLNRNILQAGGLSKLLKDKKRMAKIPLEIMQEFASNLLQTGMIPQAYLRTLIGQEAGIVKTSTYKTPEGGLIGVWKSEDPRKFSKVASILAQNAGEMFPPLFLSQQSQRNLKRIVQQSEKSPEGLGDPMTQKTITDVAANTVLPLRVYTINASSARTATLQNISPFITEIQSAKRQKEVDNYLIEHHYSHLIEIVQKCKKSFIDTGVMKEAALMQILIDSGLSRQEALMIFNKQMPAAYRRKSKITTKEKFESIQKR
jgi:hypothetical protein